MVFKNRKGFKIIKPKNQFYQLCYESLKKVPKGKVTTYKEIAKSLGINAYRAVGNAMHNNKNAPIIPCHRVVKSNGEVGGYVKGKKLKIKMLRAEGIEIKNDRIDLKKFFYKF